MKLNLGSGKTRFEGFINVDKSTFFNPDIIHDLEITPWPFSNDSVDEIVLCHVLEHLGKDSNVFIKIMQELYRICKHNACIDIVVPNPFSTTYLGDPTHVRPITPELFMLFDLRQNLEWQKNPNSAHSLFALEHNVNFEILCLDLYNVDRTRNINYIEHITESNNLLNITYDIYLEYIKENRLFDMMRILVRVVKC
jgi:SAM-dependent methyltransferase